MAEKTTTIYGIGGGNIRDPRMIIHFERITELVAERAGGRPFRMAVLPTAHLNGLNTKMGRGYMDWLPEQFEERGFETENIWIGDLPQGVSETSRDQIVEVLDRSHVLFVLGGDTRYLLESVRKTRTTDVFATAYERGLVFAGTSAGLIWLANLSMSDSESFHSDTWNYIMVEGLGILPFLVNVHDDASTPRGIIDKRSRRIQFEERLLESAEEVALAVDEMVALEITDGIARVRTADDTIGAYVLLNEDGAVRRKRFPTEEPIDLSGPEAAKRWYRSVS